MLYLWSQRNGRFRLLTAPTRTFILGLCLRILVLRSVVDKGVVEVGISSAPTSPSLRLVVGGRVVSFVLLRCTGKLLEQGVGYIQLLFHVLCPWRHEICSLGTVTMLVLAFLVLFLFVYGHLTYMVIFPELLNDKVYF